ncbi:hypothetical protein [Streptomyces sp. NPDC050982]|uniref:hypothetical protein n=1 Tax=Streptomyces sp. NPDC050982 TaxID=3154746 RepID=UPI0033CECD88
MPVPDRKAVKNRLHLDLTSAAGDREAEIERVLGRRSSASTPPLRRTASPHRPHHTEQHEAGPNGARPPRH